MKRQKGFTLIELLIVVAIIGIIAAIAIPNLLDAIERSRQKRTVADIKSIAGAVQAFSTDYGGYPPTAVSPYDSNPAAVLDDLTYMDNQGSPAFVPDYIQAIPGSDGWRIGYHFGTGLDGATTNAELGTVVARNFVLGSWGNDMLDGGSADPGVGTLDTIAGEITSNTAATAGTIPTHCYEDDIIWANSSFIQEPEGKQKDCL